MSRSEDSLMAILEEPPSPSFIKSTTFELRLEITFDINDGQFAAISEARIDAENDLASTRRSQKQVLEILPENLVGAVGGGAWMGERDKGE